MAGIANDEEIEEDYYDVFNDNEFDFEEIDMLDYIHTDSQQDQIGNDKLESLVKKNHKGRSRRGTPGVDGFYFDSHGRRRRVRYQLFDSSDEDDDVSPNLSESNLQSNTLDNSSSSRLLMKSVRLGRFPQMTIYTDHGEEEYVDLYYHFGVGGISLRGRRKGQILWRKNVYRIAGRRFYSHLESVVTAAVSMTSVDKTGIVVVDPACTEELCGTSKLLALRCNYSTGIIGQWRASPDADDLTEVTQMNNLLLQRLKSDLQSKSGLFFSSGLSDSGNNVSTGAGSASSSTSSTSSPTGAAHDSSSLGTRSASHGSNKSSKQPAGRKGFLDKKILDASLATYSKENGGVGKLFPTVSSILSEMHTLDDI